MELSILDSIGPVIILAIVCGMIWQRSNEIRWWNGGICKDTGEPWEYFDTTSQGCRGYKSGAVYTWISYNVDKRPPA